LFCDKYIVITII